MDISDELDVIRQAISSVDPDALRQITDSIDNAIKFTQDVVTPWGIVPIAAIKILTAG